MSERLNIEEIFLIYEKSCRTDGFGYGMAAREFFMVEDIKKLIIDLGDNSGYILPETEQPRLTYPVDDIADLCKKVLRKRLPTRDTF